MVDRLASIAGLEEALEKVLSPLGLTLSETTWKRSLAKGTLAVTIKVAGLTDEQLSLFGGERK
jgi:hypothetical protein